MTIKEFIDQNIAKLPASSTPRLDVLVLLEAASKRNQANILANYDRSIGSLLNHRQRATFEEFIAKRANHEPVAYILNSVEFYGISLFVDSNVMVPRPETEKLVDYLLDQAPEKARVIDIGTGSGSIAIASKYNRLDLEVFASDISEPALEVARKNAHNLNLDITFLTSDLLDSIDSDFDIYIANLPYVPKDYTCSKEVDFEPKTAIFSEKEGLDHIQRLIDQVAKALKPSDLLILEAFNNQHAKIASLAQDRGLRQIISDDFLLVLAKRV